MEIYEVRKMKKVLLALLGAAILTSVVGIFSYNHLVSLNQQVNSEWAQVQNVYQRRADLIPNLVETVKGSANFEKSDSLKPVTNFCRASVGKVSIDPFQGPRPIRPTSPNTSTHKSSFPARCRSCWSAWKPTRISSPARISAICRPSWKGLRIAFPSSAGVLTMPCKRMTHPVHSFPSALFAGAAFGFKDKPYFRCRLTRRTGRAFGPF